MNASELRRHLDEAEAVDLLRRAIATPSITGTEAGFAGFLADELKNLPASGIEQREFEAGRPNVWGVVRSEGGGKDLLLVGHTDTVHVDGWKERWAGTTREDPFSGAIENGEIWGRGAGDLKAGICAAISAVKLLERAGIELAGDVQLAFIGDEESGEPGMGVSAGMKEFAALIEKGKLRRPDFAIYLEPTNLEVYSAQMGFFITEIEIKGRSAYFGFPELGRDALRAGHAVLDHLWAHSDDLAGRAEHELVGKSFLLVTEMNSGGYIAVPGECRLSLIRKLLPGEDLGSAAAELEKVVRSAVNDPEISVDIRFPAGRDNRFGGTPTEVDPRHPAITKLLQAVNEAAEGRAGVSGAPYWSEAPFLTNLDIPTIYFAPGDIRNCHTLEERVNLADYSSGIVALAAFMADYCGVVPSKQ
ncbi:MAG: M20/M25/M40 family metallo-hydrolase [Trueperaceae bacterium]